MAARSTHVTLNDHAISPGFSVVHLGGGVDDAEVTFEPLDGFCTVSGPGGFSCAVANPVVRDKQRLAAVWEVAPGPNWVGVHGLTGPEYQRRFDELVGQGFRPVDVSGYPVDGHDRYAAIFEQREGPAFVARHGLTSAQYQQTFDELVGQGFRPVDVSGYEVGGQDRYAAIFEQRPGPAFVARHGLTNAGYQAAFDQAVGQGFRLRKVSGYGVNGQDFYAAIWEADGGPSCVARHGLTNAGYQAAFDEFVGQGFRLRQVSGYNVGGEDRYAAIWEADGGPPFTARHGLDSDQYQQTFDQLVAQGFRLTDVSGYSVG
jgi:Bacterial tandem repeat domain 1